MFFAMPIKIPSFSKLIVPRFNDAVMRVHAAYEEAVARIHLHYPDVAAKAIFINLSTHEGNQRLQEWIAERTATDENPAQAAEKLKLECYKIGSFKQGNLVCFTRNGGRTLLPSNERKEALFTVYHEFAHFLYNDRINFSIIATQQECRADLFAALTGLNEGWLDLDDIREIRDNRARMAKSPYETHATAPALDILLSTYQAGTQLSLKPADIQLIAAEYAKEATPSFGSLHNLLRRQFNNSEACTPPSQPLPGVSFVVGAQRRLISPSKK